VILRERNELIGVIQAAGLNLGQIELQEQHSYAELRHVSPGSAFGFTTRRSRLLRGAFVPGDSRGGPFYRVRWDVADGPSQSWLTCKSWSDVKAQAAAWAHELLYVTETPDFWAKFLSSGQFFSDPEVGLGNAPFTAAERAAIEVRIDEVKHRAHENPDLSAQQISGIEQRLDDLKEASERVGRKDWLTMLYGAAFGMIVNDTVPPHVVQGIITTIITGLGHIFGVGTGPTALP
jgi:hypothetical protein